MRRAQLLVMFVLVAACAYAQPPDEWTQFNARQQEILTRERAAQGNALVTDAAVDTPFKFNPNKLGNLLREANGSISAVGEIENITELTLTFPRVTFTYFGVGDVALGSATAFAFAPQNVRLNASGAYVGAMPPRSVAFYKVYSNVPYDSVRHWTVTGTAETHEVTPSVANISVTSATVAANGQGVSGRVLNTSARAFTYNTLIALAGYKEERVADVAFTYVSGLTVPCGSTISTSGVGPAGTAPYNYFFLHPVASAGRAHVTWDEFALSGTTATAPSDGGQGSIQVAANCTWTATSDSAWITIVAGGAGSSDATLSYVVTPNPGASRTGTITIKGIPFRITQAAAPAAPDAAPPFGTVDTPIDNSPGVTGSIAVTGWALDDTGVTAVRIFRQPVTGEAAGQPVFIGNAVLVAGARPDVATAYPAYPGSNRAGWGYLLLTNVLPNHGDGVFTLQIYAEDAAGRSTLIGTRTITCTNSVATLPFGAIDTPGQGQTVSGTVNNFGWVLSPGTGRADPPNGGAVSVFIDGVPVGVPSGWTNRADLTALFPVAQYAGIGSALGVFALDTTSLTNGIHTMAWAVTDNQGGTAGIGSRYFTVANGSGAQTPLTNSAALRTVGAPRPPAGRRGPDLDAPFEALDRNSDGTLLFAAEELDRIELRVDARAGYLWSAPKALPLPIGSRIDPVEGTFTWQPGPGFIGAYDLLFETARGTQAVRVTLYPRGMLTRAQVIIDAPAGDQPLAGSFTVAGWAIDPSATDGSGIGPVHVWAYPKNSRFPIFLGATLPADERRDVADVYGARGLTSGYRVTVDALAPGAYDLAVFAWSIREGRFLPATTRSLLVR